jgi:hypothetical protein
MNIVSPLRPVSAAASARNLDDQQQLCDLIGVIYDAAIDPSLWECALERAAYFVGGTGAALICKGVGARHAAAPYEFGFQRLPVALFEPIYPAAEPLFLGDIEQPIAITDLIPFDELTQTELYRQWAKPQGFVDFISAVLDRTTISAAIFGVFRHERNGIVDDLARRQMRLIAPHRPRPAATSPPLIHVMECTLIVPWEMFSRRSIALFDNPSDTRRMISRSRSVTTAHSQRRRRFVPPEIEPALSRAATAPPAICYLPQELNQGCGHRVLGCQSSRQGTRRVRLMRRKAPVAWNILGAGR